MAPADIRKEGSSYDLPLAIGILAASSQISASKIDQYIIMGELSLDGSLQPVKGVLPMAIKAKEEGFKGCILPKDNAREAAVVKGIDVLGFSNIKEVIDFLEGHHEAIPEWVDTDKEFANSSSDVDFDFSEVKGQETVKRAMEIAAAGGHNLIRITSYNVCYTKLLRN